VKIAVLSDIHANIWALDAVLDVLELAGPDVIVVTGDVAYGPKPIETIHRLTSISPKPLFVMGNADREMVEYMEGKPVGETMKPEIFEVMAWCVSHFSSDELAFLSSFRKTVAVKHPNLGEILFCHGTPGSVLAASR